MSFSTATISSAALSATISTLGAELQTLQTADGRDLLWNGDPTFWTGRAPILFPVIGMLNGGIYRYDGQTYAMPKHGFARRKAFMVTAQCDTSVTFRLDADAQTAAIYPFDFTLDVEFTLAGTCLTVTAIIANHGAAAMPASIGFHPALRWPLPFGQQRAAHRLLFDADEPAPVRRIDADGLLKPDPVATPVVGARLALRDDLFVEDALIFDVLRSRSVQYGADEGPRIKVGFADFPTLGVWSKPGAGFICIEPWQGSSDPEGFSGDIRDKPGIVMVEPGNARQQAMSITLHG
jgi:galactose mutarotase-like enzyme